MKVWRSKRNNVFLGVVALLLLLIVGVSYREWKEYAGANAQAARTGEIGEAVDKLLLDVIDAETGQRGFLLTDESRYLEPYNEAIKTIPTDVANLNRLLASSSGEANDVSRLSSLVNEKLEELRQTIMVRQTQGIAPALQILISDQGKRTMDEIRSICAGIQRRQNVVQVQLSAGREAAARTALLVTVAGALILLFLSVIGLDPIGTSDPQDGKRSWLVVYGAGIVATAAATMLRFALNPLIGENAVPFITFFPAVLFSAWYGGFRAGALSILLSTLAADYYFVSPPNSLLIGNSADQITLLIFVAVGIGMALLSHSQRLAVQRAGREASLRKDAEIAERTERQRFETTLASIGDAVVATNAAGEVDFMNAVAESLTGWKKEEAAGRPLEDVFRILNEDTRQRVENPALRAIQEGIIVGLANHTVLIARDGVERPIDDSGSPIIDGRGTMIGAVLIFRDITERRRLERTQVELLDSERIARDNERNARIDAEVAEQRLELALEAGRMGTWQYLIHGGEVRWSAGLEQIHGYDSGTFPGTFDAFQAEIHPEDRERVLRSIGGAIEQRQAHRVEYRIIRRDGAVRWVEGQGQLFLDDAGNAERMVGVCSDITERKHAAELESQAKRAAEESNRAKDEFLAILSHELRTPLSSILGWATILRSGHLRLEQASHALEVIERNARVEAQLVESLLDLSRIMAGKFKLEMERADLSSVLLSVTDSLRPAADTKGVILDVVVPSEPLIIVADSGRLQQVFSNLVSNATKFTPRGGHVSIRLSRIGSRAQVQVIDDGDGISADFLPYIFDRFRQAETTKGRAHGGLGLGLAIVRELVQAHAGTVVAHSLGQGLGSSFTVTLPIPAVIPADMEAPSMPGTHTEELSISGVRVLIVDDDPDARELVALTVETRGAVVQMVSSARDALESIARSRPDVLLADIGMPLEDGYALIQELRVLEKKHAARRLPAIALTAYATAADRQQALAAGYDLHLTKPVGPNELAHAVAKFRKVRGA